MPPYHLQLDEIQESIPLKQSFTLRSANDIK